VVLGDVSTVPISQVQVGDTVLATDPSTGVTSAQPVEQVWVNHDDDLLDLTVTAPDGAPATIHTTQHHPFWDVTQNAWVEAGMLRAGDQLRGLDGRGATVLGVTVVAGAADMWGLTVAQDHDFLIDTVVASMVLVHNCPTGEAARSWHGDLRSGERDIDAEEVRANGEIFHQDDGQAVHILERGNGTSDVVVRPYDAGPKVFTTVVNMTTKQIAKKFARGIWFSIE
jgi:hypothetical protein